MWNVMGTRPSANQEFRIQTRVPLYWNFYWSRYWNTYPVIRFSTYQEILFYPIKYFRTCKSLLDNNKQIATFEIRDARCFSTFSFQFFCTQKDTKYYSNRLLHFSLSVVIILLNHNRITKKIVYNERSSLMFLCIMFVIKWHRIFSYQSVDYLWTLMNLVSSLFRPWS